MFKLLKKHTALMICAAVFNACVLPYPTLLAVKKQVKKGFAKPAQPSTPVESSSAPTPVKSQPKDQQTGTQEVPTMQETWQKVKNFEWQSLNRADAWNLMISVGGTLSAVTAAYLLFKAKSGTGNPNGGHQKPDAPGNRPTIPKLLQDIIDTHNYSDDSVQKIKNICDVKNSKKIHTILDKENADALQNQLIKAIGNTNKTEEVVKPLIDQYHNSLQEYLKKTTTKEEPTIEGTTVATENTHTEKSNPAETTKPKVLYPHAKQAQDDGALIDVHVPKQRGLLCAIHALHNGNHITEKIMRAQGDARLEDADAFAQEISQELLNTDAFNVQCTSWTTQVGNKRKIDASEKYLNYQLQSAMKLTEAEQEEQSGLFNRIVTFFGGRLLHKLTRQETNSCNLVASILKESLIQNNNVQEIVLWHDENNIDLARLENIITQLAPQCNRNINVQQQADLHAFINALDVAQLKKHFNDTLILDENFLTKAKNHVDRYHDHLDTDFSGENLDSQELETLIEQMGKQYTFGYDRNGDLLIDFFDSYDQQDEDIQTVNNYNDKEMYNLHGKISIINDTADVTLPDNRDNTIITVIKHQMLQRNKFVHTFMIRLGNVSIGSASSTHWISVTLVRDNGNNHYFITDSIGATRMNDRNVLQLIDALES